MKATFLDDSDEDNEVEIIPPTILIDDDDDDDDDDNDFTDKNLPARLTVKEQKEQLKAQQKK